MNSRMGGNLMALWKVSQIYMPTIADAFSDASQMIGGGHNSDLAKVSGTRNADKAFEQTRESPEGFSAQSHVTPGRVYPHWAELRNELQHILSTAAQNTIDASAVTMTALNKFRGVDSEHAKAITAAGKEFDANRQSGNWVDPGDPKQNPLTGQNIPSPPDHPKGYRSEGDKKGWLARMPGVFRCW